MMSGVAVRAVIGERQRVLSEGTAVCVDAVASRLEVLSSEHAQARLEASAAAMAYDGLQDVDSLERWVQSERDTKRAQFLMAEVAPRLLDGSMPVVAARRISQAAGSKPTLAAKREWERVLALARDELNECAATVLAAPSVDVVDRVVAHGQQMAERARVGSTIFGGSDGELPALARKCQAVAAGRRKTLPLIARSVDEAAASAGASQAQAVEIGPQAWKKFMADNGLASYFTQTIDDASLGIRRKSERLREKITSGSLTLGSAAGQDILPAASQCPCLVIGEDATENAEDATTLLAAIRRVWATSWTPGPLGARLRAGRRYEFDSRIRVVKRISADVSGFLYSRDPGSAVRRVSIDTVAGDVKILLEGSEKSQRYSVDGLSGCMFRSVFCR
jgi:hypothetical protein